MPQITGFGGVGFVRNAVKLEDKFELSYRQIGEMLLQIRRGDRTFIAVAKAIIAGDHYVDDQQVTFTVAAEKKIVDALKKATPSPLGFDSIVGDHYSS